MAKKAKTEQTFEVALGRLEELVEKMESEQLPLEDLIANYEEGNDLLAHCQSLIETAKERIEVVRINRSKEAENKLVSPASSDKAEVSDALQQDDIQLL